MPFDTANVQPEEKPPTPAPGSLAAPVIAGGIAAIACGASWAAIAVFTGHEMYVFSVQPGHHNR